MPVVEPECWTTIIMTIGDISGLSHLPRQKSGLSTTDTPTPPPAYWDDFPVAFQAPMELQSSIFGPAGPSRFRVFLISMDFCARPGSALVSQCFLCSSSRSDGFLDSDHLADGFLESGPRTPPHPPLHTRISRSEPEGGSEVSHPL